ncbi:MAG: exosome complex protein Rrp42 [Conexivisphaerales archaeon]
MPKKGPIISNLRKDQILKSISEGKHIDGRELSKQRSLEIVPGIIEKAEGSASVKLGDTHVIAGIKVEVGTPFPDTPSEGILIVNAEIFPTASEYQEPGPPDEDSIELARVVDRGIRESKMVDFSKLVIEPAKQVYVIYVDIGVLGMGGNLFDASSYAAVAALMTSSFNVYRIDGDIPVKTDEKMAMPITDFAVSLTFAKIGGSIVIDPTWEEEGIMDARLTAVYDNDGRICAMQKGGSGGLKIDDVFQMVDLGKAKYLDIRKKIVEMVENAKSGN